MGINIYCWLNENNEVSSIMAGETIIPPNDYDFSGVVNSWDVVENIHLYKVENNQLVLK